MDLKHVVDLRGKKASTGVFLEVLRLRHADTLSLLLVNCHDVTFAIFDRWISRPTGVKSPLKWHNQPGQKLKDLRKSKVQTTTTTTTLGTRGFFSRVRLDASVSAVTETGNCAWKVSDTQVGKTHHLANNPEADSALIFHPSVRQSSVLLVFESTQKGQKLVKRIWGGTWKSILGHPTSYIKGNTHTNSANLWFFSFTFNSCLMLQKPGYVPLVCALYGLFLALPVFHTFNCTTEVVKPRFTDTSLMRTLSMAPSVFRINGTWL